MAAHSDNIQSKLLDRPTHARTHTHTHTPNHSRKQTIAWKYVTLFCLAEAIVHRLQQQPLQYCTLHFGYVKQMSHQRWVSVESTQLSTTSSSSSNFGYPTEWCVCVRPCTFVSVVIVVVPIAFVVSDDAYYLKMV